MFYRHFTSLFLTVFLFLTLMGPGQRAWAQEGMGDEPHPQLTEATFVATFDSEPADLTDHSFSLMLGNVRFDFTFTDEGGGYLGNGFSHSSDQGEANSGSMRMRSGIFNVNDPERIIIARNDGGLFIFNSIYLNNVGVNSFPVNVQGMRNGAPVGEAQTMNLESAGTLEFSSLLVDEVHLTGGDFNTTYMDSFHGSTTVPMDFGDLPAAYGVTEEADDGARHAIGSLYLGDCIDAEADGQESANADGDDTSDGGQTNGDCTPDGDDEDGLVPVTPWQNGTNGATVQATVTGGDGCLSGWMDWDNDGGFAESEDHILDMVSVSSGAQQVSFDVPDGTFSGSGPQTVFNARFRLIEEDDQNGCGDMPALTVDGAAGIGEVEDYSWAFSSTAVQLSQVRAGAGRISGPLVFFLCLAGLFAVYSLRKARRAKGRPQG